MFFGQIVVETLYLLFEWLYGGLLIMLHDVFCEFVDSLAGGFGYFEEVVRVVVGFILFV